MAIRLQEDLKARIAAVAKRAGTSTHDFILDAIAEKAKQEVFVLAVRSQQKAGYAQ
jgi:uncharacterized protein (DUF1778 family)